MNAQHLISLAKGMNILQKRFALLCVYDSFAFGPAVVSA